MGLSLHVGIVADLKVHDEEGYAHHRDEIAEVANRLASRGIERHVEPETLSEDEIRGWDMIGYSALHHLRFVAAHAVEKGAIPDPPDDPENDRIVKDYYARASGRPGWWARLRGRRAVAPSFEHLMLHSDAEGYYFPQDFERVVVLDDGLGAGMVGSTPRLLTECRRLTDVLKIPRGLSLDDDALTGAIDEMQGDALWQRHAKATHACLSLIEAAQASIDRRAVIAFG